MTARADVQAVVFGLDRELFALPVALVREILDLRDAFRVPEGPGWLRGLVDVRGQAVPMVDLRLRLRLGLAAAEATLATRILVVDVALDDRTITLGLVVDRVLDVSAFAADTIEGAPEIGVRWPSGYIAGVVRRDGGFVLLLDAPVLFAAQADALSAMDLRTAA